MIGSFTTRDPGVIGLRWDISLQDRNLLRSTNRANCVRCWYRSSILEKRSLCLSWNLYRSVEKIPVSTVHNLQPEVPSVGMEFGQKDTPSCKGREGKRTRENKRLSFWYIGTSRRGNLLGFLCLRLITDGNLNSLPRTYTLSRPHRNRHLHSTIEFGLLPITRTWTTKQTKQTFS